MSALKPGDNITELWQDGKIEDTKALEGSTVAIMTPPESGGSYEIERATLWKEPLGAPGDTQAWRLTQPSGRVFSASKALDGEHGFHLVLVEPSA